MHCVEIFASNPSPLASSLSISLDITHKNNREKLFHCDKVSLFVVCHPLPLSLIRFLKLPHCCNYNVMNWKTHNCCAYYHKIECYKVYEYL